MRKRMLGKLGMAAVMLAMTVTVTGISGGGTYVPDVVYAASGSETLEVDGVGSFTYTKDDTLLTVTGFSATAAVTKLDLEKIFKDNGALENGVVIGVLGKYTFKDNKDLTEIVLPSSLITIDEEAFRGCTGLTKVTFKDGESSLETIGVAAFRDCSVLTEIELHSGLKTIASSAFRDCSALTKIELPDTLEVIATWAFRQSGLTRITIPASCTTIEGGGHPSGLSFEMYVVYIGAFYNCSSLQEVVFEEREKPIAIGAHVFDGCYSLKSIEFPEKVNVDVEGKSSIPEYLFSGCTALSHVKLPSDCGQINENAFDGCALLTSIDIPEGVTNIGEKAFHGCESLGTVIFRGDPMISGTAAFPTPLKRFSHQNTTINHTYSPNIIFYCEPDTHVSAYAAEADNIPCQRLTKRLRIVEEPATTEYDYGADLDYKTGLVLEAVFALDDTDENGAEKWTRIDANDSTGNSILTNCTVTGYNKTQLGKQTVTIAYGGVEVTFDVRVAYNMDDVTAVFAEGGDTYSKVFTGSEIKPEFTLTNTMTNKKLQASDFDVTYENNLKAGTATYTITGKGNYKGERKGTFEITKAKLEDVQVTFDGQRIVYDTQPQEPVPTVKLGEYELVAGVDYKKAITYENNTDATEDGAKITIEAINGDGSSFTGTKTTYFGILQKTITEDMVAAIGDQQYTGEAITPEVKIAFETKDGDQVTLAEGDYTVKYQKNVDAGEAVVKITGKGNYTGTLEKTFRIVTDSETDTDKGTTGTTDTDQGTTGTTDTDKGTTGTTDADKGTTGTTDTDKGTTGTTDADKGTKQEQQTEESEADESDTEESDSDTKTKVKAPKKAAIKSLTNKSSKKLVVKWAKVSGAKGYEVSIATKKSFKSGTTVKTTTKTSCTFTKLKKGTTYYVRVRAYKTSKGSKVYGSYSTVKKLKIRK